MCLMVMGVPRGSHLVVSVCSNRSLWVRRAWPIVVRVITTYSKSCSPVSYNLCKMISVFVYYERLCVPSSYFHLYLGFESAYWYGDVCWIIVVGCFFSKDVCFLVTYGNDIVSICYSFPVDTYSCIFYWISFVVELFEYIFCMLLITVWIINCFCGFYGFCWCTQ